MPSRQKYWMYSFEASDKLRDRERRERHEGGDRECARGEWCSSGARVRRDDGTFHRHPASCVRAFCEKDWDLIHRCLRALPAAHDRLHKAIGDHVTREVTLRVPFGPTVPLRLDVDEVMRLIVDAVMTWHERVAEAAGLALVDSDEWHAKSLGMRSGELLPHSAQVLREHLTTLLGLSAAVMLRPSASPAAKASYAAEVINVTGETALVEAGGECAGNEIMRLEWLARACLLETPAQRERIIGVPCRECDRKALVRAGPPQHEGDPEFVSECRWCGHMLAADEYAEWTAMTAAYHRIKATLVDAPAA